MNHASAITDIMQSVFTRLLLIVTMTNSLALSLAVQPPSLPSHINLIEKDSVQNGDAIRQIAQLNFQDGTSKLLNDQLIQKHPRFMTPQFSTRSIKSSFLPAGYPDTVPAEYLSFQILNCLQDACSYLRSVMSMRAILKGMGVGDTSTTATAATVLWIMRDGAGMLGGLMFASLSSVKFGQNAKQWRLFADFINNVGITLEVIAPLFCRRSHFIALLSLASICKSLCGVAAGATNAAISEHFGSKHGNFAEIASKNGAQHTAVSLACLAISVPFIKLTSALPPVYMWILYTVLTSSHMLINHAAMKLLAFRSINKSRLSILISRYLALSTDQRNQCAQVANQLAPDLGLLSDTPYSAFTPASVAMVDPVLGWHAPQTIPRIAYWSSLSSLLLKCNVSDIADSMEVYAKCGYFIVISRDGRCLETCFKDSDVANRASSLTPLTAQLDHAKAQFEAMVIQQEMCSRLECARSADSASFRKILSECRQRTDQSWPLFWSIVEANGWDCTPARLLLRPAIAVTVTPAPLNGALALP